MDLRGLLDCSALEGWYEVRGGGRTYVKVLEKGRPLSRAKAHTRRDTEANMLKSEIRKMMACMRTRMVAPALDLVLGTSR